MEFVVVRVPGPAWDETRPMCEQDGWGEHARFMNDLAASGFIALGGPLGNGERRSMLVCVAESEAALSSRLDADPWPPALLEVESVEPWTILLHSP